MRLLVGGLFVLLFGGPLFLYACHVLHQTPTMAGPDRISVCGRQFLGPGNDYARRSLLSAKLGRIGTVVTWQGRREVWGHHVTIEEALGCGTGVYLRVGPDAFRGYALSGGP